MLIFSHRVVKVAWFRVDEKKMRFTRWIRMRNHHVRASLISVEDFSNTGHSRQTAFRFIKILCVPCLMYQFSKNRIL